MQAVILAAGRSTRTYPLTATRPKPLVPLWDQPLLVHQLRHLEGLTEEAVLVVGYGKEQIESAIGHVRHGVRLHYVVQGEQRGTAHALLAARDRVQGRALVLNGDDFYHHDDLAALAAFGDERALLVTQAPDPENRAVVQVDDDRITGIVEKPPSAPKGSWCSVGGYAIDRADLDLLDEIEPSPRGELELPDFILRLIHSRPVAPCRIEKLWLPLTYAWDVLGTLVFLWERPERAREFGLAAKARAELPSGRVSGPVHLGADVILGEGSRLSGPVSLGNGVRVGPRATLERVVAFDGVEIGEGAFVSDSVLGEGVVVGAGARLESAPGARLAIDVKGKKITPSVDKLGSILGDYAVVAPGFRVAPGTLVEPGSVLGAGSSR